MARYEKINKVLILGSGPIVIGQACEFDYSGTQACKALMKEGLEVILVNSNPATIMTDPEIATRVYVEPLTAPFVEKILEKEKPDAIIPTLGGQTALNVALALADSGVLERLNVRMLGATPKVIRAAEDRELFKNILTKVGARAPRSHLIKNFEMGMKLTEELGLPLILRPNYTLGGGGGGIAYSREEFGSMLQKALLESPTSEVLVEESILGWKEFELEVMRDRTGTFVVVCSIENLDPCGVHTGDSITVAPQQTLSDREYQAMRDEARKIVEAVGIETGGANIQFATHPQTGERVVIEMNPRVSRSSALASKATGFPIAKIAALLAIGYKLDEVTNDITKTTPCCYEPALDYVVTKVPRFTFEKFNGSKDSLTTQMKSVGEVMAIGRTFKESFQKAIQSLELKHDGLTEVVLDEAKIGFANSQRIFHVAQALRQGYSVEDLFRLTQITPWFIEEIQDLIEAEKQIESGELELESLRKWKQLGFSDATIARLRGVSEKDIQEFRWKNAIHPRFEQVDTCAGEFESSTPYYYSTYWGKSSTRAQAGDKTVAIIGSGPNRIGQGIEFDYSCVRAVQAFQGEGLKVAMINSNPETVSTDYDTANELFFEPLTVEHVREVLNFIKPKGFVAQFGGQTPIGLAHPLVRDGFNLLGSSLETIDLAEDRALFAKVCQELQLKIPKAGIATSMREAEKTIAEIGYPVICRPSYVLGGRRMEVVESGEELKGYFERHGSFITESSPLFIDQFLERALEVDVDLVRGNGWQFVGGVVEHIEAAGVHSGDSMGVLPPQRLKPTTCERIEELSLQLADKLNVIGLLNLQLAVKNDEVYVLEANPRSSRSVPFVVKAARVPLVNLAVAAILGKPLTRKYDWRPKDSISVKGVVFPFKKFPEADSVLGPEMKSTGESMGRGSDYSEALLKAFISSHIRLPLKGEIFVSLREKDKELFLPVVKELRELGYTFSATEGTAHYLKNHGVDCLELRKAHQGRPNCVDRIRSGEVAIVFNTTSGRQSLFDSFKIRRSCIDFSIPCITESDAAFAFNLALKKARTGQFTVSPLSRSESHA